MQHLVDIPRVEGLVQEGAGAAIECFVLLLEL
jgi:hypothetical protein